MDLAALSPASPEKTTSITQPTTLPLAKEVQGLEEVGLNALPGEESRARVEQQFNRSWEGLTAIVKQCLEAHSKYVVALHEIAGVEAEQLIRVSREIASTSKQLGQFIRKTKDPELLQAAQTTEGLRHSLQASWQNLRDNLMAVDDGLKAILAHPIAEAYLAGHPRLACEEPSFKYLLLHAFVFHTDSVVSLLDQKDGQLPRDRFKADMEALNIPPKRVNNYLRSLEAYRDSYPTPQSFSEGQSEEASALSLPDLHRTLRPMLEILEALQHSPLSSTHIDGKHTKARLAFIKIGERELMASSITSLLLMRSLLTPAESIPFQEKERLVALLPENQVASVAPTLAQAQIAAPVVAPKELSPEERKLQTLCASIESLHTAQKTLERAKDGVGDESKQAGPATVRVKELLSAIRQEPPEQVEAALAHLVNTYIFTVSQAGRIRDLLNAPESPEVSVDDAVLLAELVSDELGVVYSAEELSRAKLNEHEYDQRRGRLLWALQPEGTGVHEQTAQKLLTHFLTQNKSTLLLEESGFGKACEALTRCARIAAELAKTFECLDPDLRPIADFQSRLPRAFEHAHNIAAQQNSVIAEDFLPFEKYMTALAQICEELKPLITSPRPGYLPELHPTQMPAEFSCEAGLQRLAVKLKFVQLTEALGQPSYPCTACLRWLAGNPGIAARCWSIEQLCDKSAPALKFLSRSDLEAGWKVLIGPGALRCARGTSGPYSLETDTANIANDSLAALVSFLVQKDPATGIDNRKLLSWPNQAE